jgi:putative glutamine amidotransferase
VWRGGALVQDLKTAVNHRPGREVVKAHPVQIREGSRLKEILPAPEEGDAKEGGVEVNSSHHQAIRTPGDNLRVSAVSQEDGVVEAVELDAANHFRARFFLRLCGRRRNGSHPKSKGRRAGTERWTLARPGHG